MVEMAFLALPMAVVIGGFCWAEVTRIKVLGAAALAAIEAEKQVKIAEAQAGAKATPSNLEPSDGL